jgi:hypothetical protein
MSPNSASTASTLRAAVDGSPRLAQTTSAAALSDWVMAAIISAVGPGESGARRAVITTGTFIVDHAGPVPQSPNTTGGAKLPTADIAIPSVASILSCKRANSPARPSGEFIAVDIL